MFTIKEIQKEEIENTEYVHDYKATPYAVLENEKIIAYVWLNITERNTLWLDMIEVIEKENGLGTRIVNWLFNQFNIGIIEGLVLCEERSYYFWESLGAEIYYIDTEGYDVDECLECGFESHFTLTKKTFE